jgi:hypothetical protein
MNSRQRQGHRRTERQADAKTNPSGENAFANDLAKQGQWAAFLRHNSLTGISEQFSEVVA